MERYVYRPNPYALPTSHYDKEKADKVVNFIQCLKHGKGAFAGEPFMLLPWQEELVRHVYGTVDENGIRQHRSVYCSVGKKCGKTELIAALCLYALAADGEIGAEVYAAAADRKQASICFNAALSMVRQNPALMKRMKIVESQKRMIYLPTNSVFAVLSGDAKYQSGYNISCLCFDELFCQPDDRLYNMLTSGTGDARKQPLHFLISTAGNDTNSICFKVYQKAKDIIEGRKSDPSFYPAIYEVGRDEPWDEEENWYKANPSLGVTIDVERVREACESAKQNPFEESSFRQLRLNQWVTASVRWMPMARWDSCDSPVNPEDLYGRPCYAGIDLASVNDLCAMVLVFPPYGGDEKYSILPFAWVPEGTIEQRSRRDHVKYDLWARDGYVLMTEGDTVDYDAIEMKVLELREHYDIREIAYDRWNAAMLIQHLSDEGMTVVPFGQGFKDMSAPTRELYKLTLEKKLAHGGHPVLSWCMDNVVVQTDPAGNIKPSKAKSSEKIDLVVALIMALDRAIRNELSSSESVYEKRGLLFI